MGAAAGAAATFAPASSKAHVQNAVDTAWVSVCTAAKPSGTAEPNSGGSCERGVSPSTSLWLFSLLASLPRRLIGRGAAPASPRRPRGPWGSAGEPTLARRGSSRVLGGSLKATVLRTKLEEALLEDTTVEATCPKLSDRTFFAPSFACTLAKCICCALMRMAKPWKPTSSKSWSASEGTEAWASSSSKLKVVCVFAFVGDRRSWRRIAARWTSLAHAPKET
mmetsp:Transcript_16836/g.56901  ORF Transcript_16836/g.56901 Transcript_16836/m.56901 type:complete len:222 (-) Transcript_16836:658-1323(-)